ncbi:MAG: response regulator [bacterium]
MNILGVSGDDPSWTEFTQQLQKQDVQLTTYGSCKQAYKKLAADPSWDMVVVNADHAEQCGLKLLRTIKSDPNLAWIPILIVGTSFLAQNIAEYAKLDAQDIVMLPVDDNTLAGKLASAEKCGKRTVLVVDDEAAIRGLVSEFLHLQRFRAIQASSGEMALEILEKEPVHLVVSDIIMPGMTGSQLLVEIKERYPNIPVILITGYGGAISPQKAVEYGADGYFAKPFKNMELIYTIRRVLQQYQISPRHKRHRATPVH